jgi:hypothetical protein
MMTEAPDLLAAIRRLQHLSHSFRAHSRFLVPDLALMGYMAEAEENALTVDAIVASTVPHRAFPNARMVFEAAQLALLLVTHSDYRYAGSLAWVFHLRKDHKLQDDFEEMFGESEASEERGLELTLQEIADVWEEYSPGSGELISRAAQELASRGRGPDNWLGRSIGKALDEQIEGLPMRKELGLPVPKAGTFAMAYAMLCRGTHPQTHIRPKEIRGHEGGEVTIVPEQRDPIEAKETAIAFAAASVNYACLALTLRSRMMNGGGDR